jgi:hypothetical protein
VSEIPADDEDEGGADERSEVEYGIAEQIVALSQASDAPSEFEPPGRALDQDEVDFGSASWMTCLAEIQGWLRLSDDLELDDPRTFIERLAVGLGFDQLEAAVESVDGHPRLTLAGLDRLHGRLQHALQLQAVFLADLEADGGSQASATGRWREAWDESDEE